MEVIYYQLAIIFSLVISRILNLKLFYIVLGGWIIWTVSILTAFSPLFIVQSFTIGATCFTLNKASSQKSKIRELEESKSKLSSEHKKKIQDVLDNKISSLSTKQHYPFLLETLQSSELEVLILSGWIGSQVVDRKFIKILEQRFKSGVSVFVGFGYEKGGKHELGAASKDALRRLERLSKQFPKQLYVGRFPNHEKVLVVDKSTIVYGSANWLNNRSYVNSESSVVINDENLAIEESKRIKKMILENLV